MALNIGKRTAWSPASRWCQKQQDGGCRCVSKITHFFFLIPSGLPMFVWLHRILSCSYCRKLADSWVPLDQSAWQAPSAPTQGQTHSPEVQPQLPGLVCLSAWTKQGLIHHVQVRGANITTENPCPFQTQSSFNRRPWSHTKKGNWSLKHACHLKKTIFPSRKHFPVNNIQEHFTAYLQGLQVTQTQLAAPGQSFDNKLKSPAYIFLLILLKKTKATFPWLNLPYLAPSK